MGKVLDLEDGSVSKGPNKNQTLLSVFMQLRSWQMSSESEQQQSLALEVPLETLIRSHGTAGETEDWSRCRTQVRQNAVSAASRWLYLKQPGLCFRSIKGLLKMPST